MSSSKKKPSKDPEVHRFAENVRKSTDQKIWNICHPSATLELCEEVIRDIHEDIISVLAPHFDDDVTQKITSILGNWYGFTQNVEVVDEKRAEYNKRFNPSEDREIAPGKVYRHFKGNYYQVLHVGMNTETTELMVVYRSLMDETNNAVFIRPKSVFESEVDHEKYPNATQKWRFQRVEEVPRDVSNT